MCLVTFVLVFGTAVAVFGASSKSSLKQKTFATPETAVQAFVDALKTGHEKAFAAIVGSDCASSLSSGDKVQDKIDRDMFIKAYEEKSSLEKMTDGRVVLHVGSQDWSLPFPLVRKGSKWLFDTKTGKDELLRRRVGRNELQVIGTMEEYVTAQREYASKDRTGAGVSFAQKILSTPGKKDGLYWEVKGEEETSPLGPLVAMAAQEGYRQKPNAQGPSPFQGYYFRILTAQGDKALGGAYNYVVKDKMILGFGLIAYPAKYRASGVMTFIVNQEGIVYQKDLGEKTIEIASAIKVYDPDSTWTKTKLPAPK